MFDPERDDDRDSRRFYVRLLTVVLVAGAACAALLPSVTAFSSGIDGEKRCVAITDGWHADHSLRGVDKVAERTSVGLSPTPDQVRALAQANTKMDWLQGPGACVPESRHRLMLSGFGLGGLFVIAFGAGAMRRARPAD